MSKSTLTIIGSGNMGSAIISGLLRDGYPKENIWVTDPDKEKLKYLHHLYNVHTTTDNIEAAKAAQVILLAVKPQIIKQVCAELKAVLAHHSALVISIAAGIKCDTLQQYLGNQVPVIRAMPNTPALVGCSATALFANALANDQQRSEAESILRAVGLVVWLDNEKLMDVITAVSGSGPAYFFLLMESLQTAAEKLGLDKDIARLMTLQTAFGAARMALESEESVAMLRAHVTSKGGTTEQAIKILEEANIKEIFARAVAAAAQRSEELAENFR